MVDARDLKSLGSDPVPVRVRPPAPARSACRAVSSRRVVAPKPPTRQLWGIPIAKRAAPQICSGESLLAALGDRPPRLMTETRHGFNFPGHVQRLKHNILTASQTGRKRAALQNSDFLVLWNMALVVRLINARTRHYVARPMLAHPGCPCRSPGPHPKTTGNAGPMYTVIAVLNLRIVRPAERIIAAAPNRRHRGPVSQSLAACRRPSTRQRARLAHDNDGPGFRSGAAAFFQNVRVR